MRDGMDRIRSLTEDISTRLMISLRIKNLFSEFSASSPSDETSSQQSKKPDFSSSIIIKTYQSIVPGSTSGLDLEM